MKLRRLARAEYATRPSQLLRRAFRTLRRSFCTNQMTVRLPWGHPLRLNPRECVGRAIIALDVHDLPVTESQWRLTDPGETCADVGANIGFATSVFAARLRSSGQVWCFEPIPNVLTELEFNVEAWRLLSTVEFRIWPVALSDADGPMSIHLPTYFADNQGTASLEPLSAAAHARSLTIRAHRLDSILDPSNRLGVMKVDVEGAEARVFRGASKALSEQRIRDIIFEEHRKPPTEPFEILIAHGFTIWRVTRGGDGPMLSDFSAPAEDNLDSPTFLATLDPDRARSRFSQRGWLCVKGG